jgi:hypothetical protein
MEANWVGTILAILWMLIIPWSVVSAIWGRPWLILSIERVLTKLVIGFVVLMLLRWGIVLAMKLL